MVDFSGESGGETRFSAFVHCQKRELMLVSLHETESSAETNRPKRPGDGIAFTSNKAALAKSTLAVNTATALPCDGIRIVVLLIDAYAEQMERFCAPMHELQP